MFRFEFPYILWFLIFVPLMVVVFIFIQRHKLIQLNKAADNHLHNHILPLLSFGKQRLKFILVMIAYTCLVLAAANPQKATTADNKERKGCDIMICLDVSNSMLAEDLQPNRLERAKLAITQLISQLNGDRIGLVVFAGSSFTFLPLTSDYATAKMFTDVVDTKLIDNQGTDIHQALLTAIKGFGETDSGNKRTRTIILISDGEDNQPEAENIAKDLSKKNITVNCIGIGSPQGAKIPVKENGITTFKKDKDGNIVITKLNEATLKNIASATNGKYLRATGASLGLNTIMQSINNMDKKNYNDLSFKDYETLFYIPAIIALILLLAEFVIFNSKNKYINRKLFFGKD
ncbi:MAG: VWA domain-containing protein [Bacteroidales bacterium]|nr:VWA domain-containing protein [Bacteroidales bacterium]